MAVNRLTGCSAITVPRSIAHATRTQCLSIPVPFRDGATSEQGFASSQKTPIEAAGEALRRFPADRFVAPTPQRVHRTVPSLASDWTGPDLLFRACHCWQFPLPSGQTGAPSASILRNSPDLAHLNFSRAITAVERAICGSGMPEDGFGRCDSHHEMGDFRLRKSLREFP